MGFGVARRTWLWPRRIALGLMETLNIRASNFPRAIHSQRIGSTRSCSRTKAQHVRPIRTVVPGGYAIWEFDKQVSPKEMELDSAF